MSKLSETLVETIKFLEINPVDLAEKSGLPLDTVLGLLRGDIEIDEAMDAGLQIAFGTRRGYWLQFKD